MTEASIDDPARQWARHDHDPELARAYVRDGLWTDETVGAFVMDRLATAAADRTVTVIGHRDTASRRQSETLDAARRFANGLRTLGVRAGDVVAFQLSNSVEAAATFYGIALAGAVAVPIVPFYGSRELRAILHESGARVFVAGASFTAAPPRPNFEEIRAASAGVETIVTADGASRTTRWAELLDVPPLPAAVAVDPSEPALLAYTSGTTTPLPKGVVHSHRTLLAEVRQLAIEQPNEPPPIIGAPVGHAIGMLGALLVPIALGRSVMLADGWNPRRILDAMIEFGVPAGTGAPFFLTSLLDHRDFSDEHRALVRYVGLGGAPVPADVVARCAAEGTSLVRMYGLTEHPSVSGASHNDPAERRTVTDGRPLTGVEVRIVDDDGRDVAPGARGEVLTRGPDRCIGFVDAERADVELDANGWLHTGDIATLDADGWLTIVDRKKDLIIKGGENLSPGEIESHLARHPDFAEVAVVGAPDPVVGERVRAVVRLRPGCAAPDIAELRRFLRGTGFAAQKWPDDIETVDDFPRTPAGKIRKRDLRP